MPFKGDLSTIGLAEVFQMISMSGREGTLVVTDAANRKSIYFGHEGIRLFATGNRRSLRVGDMLVRAGKAAPAVVEEALVTAKEQKRLVGEVLVSMGAVSEEDMRGMIRAKIEEEIYDLFLWTRADYEFAEGPPPTELRDPELGATGLSFDVNALILEAVRREDEWGLIRRRIPSVDGVFTFVSEEARQAALSEESVRKAASLVDGSNSVAEIAESAGASTFEISKILAGLADRGAIRPLELAELTAVAARRVGEGRSGEARKVLQSGLAQDPDSPEAVHAMARLLESQGVLKEAGREFARAGRLYAGRGETGLSKECVERAVKLDPDDTEVKSGLFEIYTADGALEEGKKLGHQLVLQAMMEEDFGRAQKFCDRVLEADPGDHRFRVLRARIFHRSGQEEPLAQELAYIREHMPADPAAAEKVERDLREVADSDFTRVRALPAQAASPGAVSPRTASRFRLRLIVPAVVLAGLGWAGVRYEANARAELDVAISLSSAHLGRQSFVEARRVMDRFLEGGHRFSLLQGSRARAHLEEIEQRRGAWERERVAREESMARDAGARVKEIRDRLVRERERNPTLALDLANQLYARAEQSRMPEVQREAEEISRVLTAHLTEAFDLKRRADDLEAAGKFREAALQVDQLQLKYASTEVAKTAFYPVGLRVRPTGVLVTLMRNGTALGVTGAAPLKYRMRSGETVRFRFEKRGYVGEERDVTDKTVGEMAVDLTQKQELWRVPLGVQIIGTPAVEGGTLFVAGANRLYALADSERPELLWSEVLEGEISGPPRAAKGLVTLGTSAGWLYGVDSKRPREQRIAWKLALGNALRGSPAVSPDGATIYGVTADRVLHAVDAARGVELWRVRLPAGTRVEPVAAAGLVVVACEDGTLIAMRGPRREDEAWRLSIPGGIEALGSDASTLYVVGADRKLRSIEASRGGVIWTSPMEAGATGRPERSGGTVYVPGRDGRLRYIDAATGARSAAFVSKGALEGGVTFAPSIVMFGSDDEYFYACDAATARMWWKLKSKGRVRPGAVVGSGRVYFCCEDSVYAVELN